MCQTICSTKSDETEINFGITLSHFIMWLYTKFYLWWWCIPKCLFLFLMCFAFNDVNMNQYEAYSCFHSLLLFSLLCLFCLYTVLLKKLRIGALILSSFSWWFLRLEVCYFKFLCMTSSKITKLLLIKSVVTKEW